MAERILKDPAAQLDYGRDWEPWLDTDRIVASTWTVPAGLTQVADTHTDTQTVVWLSGGVAGATYTITNQISTAAGRTDERSLVIVCAER